jgi:hypothetical protein
VSGKGKLQALILVVGLICAIIAYGTTPKIYAPSIDGVTVPCRPNIDQSFCFTDVPTASTRGGGVLLLTILAFGGVAVVIKDD